MPCQIVVVQASLSLNEVKNKDYILRHHKTRKFSWYLGIIQFKPNKVIYVKNFKIELKPSILSHMKLSEQNWDLNKILNDLYKEYDILSGTDYFQSAKRYGKYR